MEWIILGTFIIAVAIFYRHLRAGRTKVCPNADWKEVSHPVAMKGWPVTMKERWVRPHEFDAFATIGRRGELVFDRTICRLCGHTRRGKRSHMLLSGEAINFTVRGRLPFGVDPEDIGLAVYDNTTGEKLDVDQGIIVQGMLATPIDWEEKDS